jgi:hypothetical protein
MQAERLISGVAGAIATGFLWQILTTFPAHAAGPSKPRDAGTVTGCSRVGQGCVTAPVRQGRHGLEVRLPSGTWISCAGDCRDALRSETVDFWEEHQPRENTM